MSGKYYAADIGDNLCDADEQVIENIDSLVLTGNVIILCEELEELEELGIKEDAVVKVV